MRLVRDVSARGGRHAHGAVTGSSRGGRLPGVRSDGDEDPRIEADHDDARDVEGAHRRVDEEVGVVEGADGRRLGSAVRVVHAEGDRRRDGSGDDPRHGEHGVDATRVLVLGVLDRLRHGDESTHTHDRESSSSSAFLF